MTPLLVWTFFRMNSRHRSTCLPKRPMRGRLPSAMNARQTKAVTPVLDSYWVSE